MTKPITVRPGPTLQAGEMPVVSPVPAAPDRGPGAQAPVAQAPVAQAPVVLDP
jgi:hypothetical protein